MWWWTKFLKNNDKSTENIIKKDILKAFFFSFTKKIMPFYGPGGGKQWKGAGSIFKICLIEAINK